MSNDTKKIDAAAEEAGYQLGYSRESYGDNFFGLRIYVKLSQRKLVDEDTTSLDIAADDIKKRLETTSAKLDPDGPMQRIRYKQDIAGIYKAAGVDAIFMEEKPNGYCSLPCCLNRPWFRVTSSIGHILIGWRKRVLEIEWKDTVVKLGAHDLFPDDNVTRWESGIHAWSLDDATRYIKKLHER